MEIPATDEFPLFLNFSNGVTMTPGYCARCGSKVGKLTCDVCGYSN